ncbi:S-layer homology domain-containing protein [Aneurinibacillus sp. Ricciae_BoGa-3]|uniref:S-layer homology domain-containing protein n=1 Tax=Aneurinibacillus sp. Ricciae_BoGa-3 TaxID=3022697 RepID=UPI00234109B6|nr:S-layer homology domain-containing protein [Aneurinibacillus sp. Ricciae_BoGa-3]WCK53523.1 S-layer homology domain-containing protein [Aneurinibacillus sp. Ricciae_BoGa-3]
MKKRSMLVTGLVSLSMLMGSPVANALAAGSTYIAPSHSNLITRGEFFNLLVNAVDLSQVEAIQNFKDVNKTSPYYAAAAKLQGNHIVSGFTDHTLRLNQPVKQIEAIAFIGRALGIPNSPLAGSSSPLAEKHWAYNLSTWFNGVKANMDWTQSDKLLTKEEAQTLIQQLLSTSADVQTKLADSQQKQSELKSASMKLSLSAKVEGNAKAIKGHEQEWAMVQKMVNQLVVNGDAAYVLPDKMKINIAMNMPAMPNMPAMSGPINMEEYIIGKDLYLKTPAVPGGQGSQWLKIPNAMPDMGALMQQKTQLLPPQLQKSLFYRDLGNGQYAFQGKISHFSDLAGMFDNGTAGLADIKAALQQADALIGSLYIQGTMTIDPKTGLMSDMDVQIAVTLNDKAIGQDIPIKSVFVNEKIKMTDYNTDIKIELPAEAKNAQVIPAFTGMPGVASAN